MKQIITLRLTLLFCMISFNNFAAAFVVDGIYYSVISSTDRTVRVTPRTASDTKSGLYHGDIKIPTSVTYDGTTYSVTEIGNKAFKDSTELTSIQIPNSVTKIGNYAFEGCSGLTSIQISNSVTSIGYEAFRGCSGLTSIEIPNGVTSIGTSTFAGCSGLTSVKIPNSVTSIGTSAFHGCTGLTSIEIPNSVTSIGSSTFSGCSGLTSIEILNGVTSIGGFAFSGCSGLTSIQIPNSVTNIGNYAFLDCTGLTSIEIPNSVTSIGDYAFSGCSGLTSIEIPKSVTSIGEYAFNKCTGLTSIVVATGNSVYDSREDCNAIIETATNTLIAGCKNTFIPNSVTSIGKCAFFCSELLTGIIIPSSVTSIDDGAFSGCKFKDIQVLANTPPTIIGSPFSSQCTYHSTLFVPFGCYDNYAYDDTYWYKFIHIKESASSTQNLSPEQAYTLKSATTRSYIVYDAVNDAVGEIAWDANIDEDNANHNWQVIEQEGNTYIYNIGAKKYLYANAQIEAASMRPVSSSFATNATTQWELSTSPIAVSLSSGESGINIGNNGEWLFVLNPALAVDENVSAIEQLETAHEAISEKCYNLQGLHTSSPNPNGLYIREGKTVMMK